MYILNYQLQATHTAEQRLNQITNFNRTYYLCVFSSFMHKQLLPNLEIKQRKEIYDKKLEEKAIVVVYIH